MNTAHVAKALPEGGHLLVVTGPSAAGKTTLADSLLEYFPGRLTRSISATSRDRRSTEQHGRDYDFIGRHAFIEYVEHEMFLEWQQVYNGVYYGTPKDRVVDIWNSGQSALLVIDVIGAHNLKRLDSRRVTTIAVMPPSLHVLRERLMGRGTETEEQIKERLDKAAMEMSYIRHYGSFLDYRIMNDDLSMAKAQITALVGALEFMRTSLPA